MRPGHKTREREMRKDFISVCAELKSVATAEDQANCVCAN